MYSISVTKVKTHKHPTKPCKRQSKAADGLTLRRVALLKSRSAELTPRFGATGCASALPLRYNDLKDRLRMTATSPRTRSAGTSANRHGTGDTRVPDGTKPMANTETRPCAPFTVSPRNLLMQTVQCQDNINPAQHWHSQWHPTKCKPCGRSCHQWQGRRSSSSCPTIRKGSHGHFRRGPRRSQQNRGSQGHETDKPRLHQTAYASLLPLVSHPFGE